MAQWCERRALFPPASPAPRSARRDEAAPDRGDQGPRAAQEEGRRAHAALQVSARERPCVACSRGAPAWRTEAEMCAPKHTERRRVVCVRRQICKEIMEKKANMVRRARRLGPAANAFKLSPSPNTAKHHIARTRVAVRAGPHHEGLVLRVHERRLRGRRRHQAHHRGQCGHGDRAGQRRPGQRRGRQNPALQHLRGAWRQQDGPGRCGRGAGAHTRAASTWHSSSVVLLLARTPWPLRCRPGAWRAAAAVVPQGVRPGGRGTGSARQPADSLLHARRGAQDHQQVHAAPSS